MAAIMEEDMLQANNIHDDHQTNSSAVGRVLIEELDLPIMYTNRISRLDPDHRPNPIPHPAATAHHSLSPSSEL